VQLSYDANHGLTFDIKSARESSAITGPSSSMCYEEIGLGSSTGYVRASKMVAPAKNAFISCAIVVLLAILAETAQETRLTHLQP
jgi:hypothetical protein